MKGKGFVAASLAVLVVGLGLGMGAVLSVGEVAWVVRVNGSLWLWLWIPLLLLFAATSLTHRRR